IEPPAAVSPDRRAHRDRAVQVGEPAALFHVQFDEAPDSAERLRVRAERLRVAAGGAQSLGERGAVDVAQPQCLLGGGRPGQDPGPPPQATPKRAPSSSEKFTTASGRDGVTPSRWRASITSRALTTPRGPSKAPPSGTESRCEPIATPGVPVLEPAV